MEGGSEKKKWKRKKETKGRGIINTIPAIPSLPFKSRNSTIPRSTFYIHVRASSSKMFAVRFSNTRLGSPRLSIRCFAARAKRTACVQNRVAFPRVCTFSPGNIPLYRMNESRVPEYISIDRVRVWYSRLSPPLLLPPPLSRRFHKPTQKSIVYIYIYLDENWTARFRRGKYWMR